MKFVLAVFFLLGIFTSYANDNLVESHEYLEFPFDGGGYLKALVKRGDLGGFTELLPFVSHSPNQEFSGSCHFMAINGNVEWWLARLNPKLSREPQGPIDLSERYLMNMDAVTRGEVGKENWIFDLIYVYNHLGHGVLNSAYPYTKGWYKRDEDGKKIPAEEDEPKAKYGTTYNWINESNKIKGGKVELPKFDREVIFKDPEDNRWNVMVTPKDIVEKVKNALVKNKAPVTVMFNNFSYWHVVMIVGFDDQAFNDNCSDTKGFGDHMISLSDKLVLRAEQEADLEKKEKLLKKSKRYSIQGLKFNREYEKRGACSGKGAFYVRESIYSDPDDSLYNYFTDLPGDEKPYAAKVILRSYEWLEYLSNHIYQIKTKI